MKQYLLISSIYLAVFYLIYILLISKDTRYRRNRLYLLASIILSLLLPFVKISAVTGGMLSSLNENLGKINIIPQINVYAIDKNPGLTNTLSLPLIIYLTGTIVAFTLYMANFFKLICFIKKYRIKGSRLIITPSGKESGFSAMGFIFLSSDLVDEIKNTILEHEKQHIRKKHFIDICLIRFIGVFFWFNPFVYIYERSLKALHEFEADEQMLDSGQNVISYQKLILNQIFNTSIFTLQNGFSGRSLIKKRMIMMTKKRSKGTTTFKLLLALPIIVFVFGYLSCASNENNPLETVEETGSPAKISDLKAEENESLSLEKISEETQIFTVVEEMPTFQGGDINKFRDWVQKNVKYPDVAKENGIQGKVFVKFIVDKQGSVKDVIILRGVDPSLDNEAMKVVKSSPQWGSGKQRGAEVPVEMRITVNFQLQ